MPMRAMTEGGIRWATRTFRDGKLLLGEEGTGEPAD